MFFLAIKMLLGDKVKFLSLILAVFFSSLLILLQMGIFIGLVQSIYKIITDIPNPDIWVMDPFTEDTSEVRYFSDYKLDGVRSVLGVEWVAPIHTSNCMINLIDGKTTVATLYGIDEWTLVGAPIEMIAGNLEDIHQPGAIIVDERELNKKLAMRTADGGIRPLKIGDSLEVNDIHARVVGICRTTIPFFPKAILYTSFSNARTFANYPKKTLSFIAVKAKIGENLEELASRITKAVNLKAYTKKEFRYSMMNFIFRTGIILDFGLAVAIGACLSSLIIAQTFYAFTVENIKLFAVAKAVGATNQKLQMIIFIQALVVSLIGIGISSGFATLLTIANYRSSMTFDLPWQLFLASGNAVILITLLATGISIYKIMRLDPAIIFRN